MTRFKKIKLLSAAVTCAAFAAIGTGVAWAESPEPLGDIEEDIEFVSSDEIEGGIENSYDSTTYFNYTINSDGTASISRYFGTEKELTIPSTIDDKAVTSIGRFAFYNCDSLTSITIPSSVTSIGESAFDGCSSLKSINVDKDNYYYGSVDGVLYELSSYKGSLEEIRHPSKLIKYPTGKEDESFIIPSDVYTLDDNAFEDCTYLKNVTIPSSVVYITYHTTPHKIFRGCTSLENINVNEENAYYSSENGVLFSKDMSKLIEFPSGKKGSYIIPNSVTSIDEGAFYNCSNLTNITIPDSVTDISSFAFDNCTSLTSITIPNGVMDIGRRVFSGCTSLTSVTIPDSVTSIGTSAFYGCTSLTSITIPGSVTSIGASAFSGCTSLTSINVDESNANYKSVDGVLFSKDMSKLIAFPGGKTGSYVIPDGVTLIEDSAFYRCASLTSITIPDSVKSIGDLDFQGCSSLKSITLPNSVTSIENITFTNCTSLTSITIPDSVKSISDSAFKGCSSLTSITIPDGVTSIGKFAFSGCKSLKSIIIPNSITSIGLAAFQGCSSLKSITLSNSITSIPEQMLLDCTSLTSITIPDSVKSISDSAFRGCSSLTSVTIPNSVTSLGISSGDPNVLRSTWVFEDCTSLTSITIPDSVTFMGESNFVGCSSLTSINVDANNKKYKSKDGVLFDKDMYELLAFPGGKGGSYAIPNCVININGGAFSGCAKLTSVTIPDSVKTINWRAFEGCRNLKSIIIPDSVEYIGEEVFLDCDNLTIYGDIGSYAETYAKNNSISFKEFKVSFTSKVTATSSNRSIKLSWNAVDGATNYIVKSADGKTQYTKNAITDTSYTVTGLKNGTQYKFKVYAKISGSWCSSSVVTKTPVAKPENVKAVANNKKVKLTWNKVSGATGYIVKSADGKTQYTKSAITSNSYTVTGLKNGTQYKFKVYAKSDGKWFASSTISKTPTASPQNVTATAGSKKITLSWDKVDGATGYVIKSADGKTQYTKTFKTNSYTVTGLKGKTQYKFKVYAKVDGKWYASVTKTKTTKA